MESPAFDQNQVALPHTVFAVQDSKVNLAQELQSAFDVFAEADDVWSADFARNVFIQASKDRLPFTLQSQKKYHQSILSLRPYVSLLDNVLTLLGRFRSLDAAAYGEQFPSALTVAVPSRLHYNKTETEPYAGLRLAIKDIIDLKGIKTGASSRAYTELHLVREETPKTVKRLIDLGFVVVGKLKSSQFADFRMAHLRSC